MQPIHTVYGGAHLFRRDTAPKLGRIARKAFDAHHHLLPVSAEVKDRIAAKLDVMQISEITKVIDASTFERPIYAGNAIMTVKSSDAKKVVTVRGTAFQAVAATGSAPVETAAAPAGPFKATFVSEELQKSDRPELASAVSMLIKELTVNAAKANFKKLLFLENSIDVKKPEDYERGMRLFREAITDYLHHRAAADLGEAAWNGLHQLRTLLAAAEAAEPRRLHELMTESQFGFHQSLRAWPGNPRARMGLREYLITVVGYEARQGNLSRADALLAQLEDPPPELTAQVSALRERTSQRDARDARLRALEQAQDWRLGARQRVIFFLCTIGFLAAMWRIAVYAQRAAPDTIAPLSLAGYAAVALAGTGMLVALFRRHLFITRVTRQLVLGVLCTIGGMCLSRALLALPAPSTAAAVSADQMLAAATAAVGGVMLARWIWWLVPIFLFGALYSRLVPTQAGGMFVLCATASCLLGLSMLRSRR